MSNYLYNGVELPALPAWDKITYPYVALYYSDDTGMGYSEKANLLLFSKVVYGYSTDGTYGLKWTESEYVILKNADGWGKWSGPSELTILESIVYLPNSITWSNFDILNEDGTVALKASDPVPVGGEAVEPTNSDIYIKKGGKVYKVNGGAGSPIHTFNSVEEMNAANLADGSIACVPSSGDTLAQAKDYTDRKAIIVLAQNEEYTNKKTSAALAEAKKYTTDVTEHMWSTFGTQVNLAKYVNLQAALTSPGGKITLPAPAGTEFATLLSIVFNSLLWGPCSVIVGVTAAGDVEGNRAYVTLVPQVSTFPITTTFFVIYEGNMLMVYWEISETSLTCVAQVLNMTPMVPAT